MGDTGLEPVTPSLSSKRLTVLSGASKELATTPLAVCTPVCTSDTENPNAAPSAEPIGQLDKLASTLNALSPAERAALLALLQSAKPNEGDHA